jgi:phosphate transport system permease protein
MAALPSVVVGFVAGLYLRPWCERYVVPLLLMMVVMPGAGTAERIVWAQAAPGGAPAAAGHGAGPHHALAPARGLGLPARRRPLVERTLFAGDFRMWLSNTALGLTYDQRNSLVVGLAMGFAVDPHHLHHRGRRVLQRAHATSRRARSRSGASRWQTALRVVVPTASPASSPRS